MKLAKSISSTVCLALAAAMAIAVASCRSPHGNLDDHPVRRRQAFRAAVAENPSLIRSHLDDSDEEIRRYALYCLVKADGTAALPQLRKALADSDLLVELTAVEALAGLAPQSAEARALLTEALPTLRTAAARETAVKASWPFHRDIKLLRNDASWDHEVTVVQKIDLPLKGWRFMTDPQQDAHTKNVFGTDFDDSGWRTMDIGYWEFQGVDDYNGIAWYRIRFTLPDKIDHNAVEIHFDGVDESAWVWLNGIYLGCHDLGEMGVDMPFAMDGTQEARWGGENVLTVRILDTGRAGGITKPVHIEILK